MATLIRPATPPEVKRSPMASRDPTVAQDQPEVGPVIRREWRGCYIVWGILAVIVTVFELARLAGDEHPVPDTLRDGRRSASGPMPVVIGRRGPTIEND